MIVRNAVSPCPQTTLNNPSTEKNYSQSGSRDQDVPELKSNLGFRFDQAVVA